MTEDTGKARPFYWASEIPNLIGPGTPSLSSFYRYVSSGKIRKADSQGQSETAYNGDDVRRFLNGELSRKKKQPSTQDRTRVVQSGVESRELPKKAESRPEPQPVNFAETDWIQESDLPYVFGLDYEVYGLDATVSPLVTRFWWEKNPYACRVLFNSSNRKDVWGALTILPMQEDTIFRILKGELQEKDITPNHILTYEPGGIYDGYIASFAIRPERSSYLKHLLYSVLDYWCAQYPQIQLRRLYAFAHGGEGSDGMRIIRKMFFSPLYERRDIEFENAWELRLDRYNPSKLVQHFQKCIQEKQSSAREDVGSQPMIIATPSESTDTNKSANFLVSRRKLKPEAVERMASRAELAGRYRDVQSEDDLRAIVEIGDLIFGASNVSDETLLELFSSWWRKNPEIFHVLDVEGSIEGFTSLLPLRPEKIESIIREEIRMSDISESDILPFEPGSPVQLFVHVVGVRPHPQSRGAVKRNFGGQLVSGIAQTFLDFGRRGIHITSVEARSNTYDGINLSTQLGFEEVPPPSGVKKKVFRLDTSTASLLGEYRNLLEKNSEGGSLSEEDERTL